MVRYSKLIHLEDSEAADILVLIADEGEEYAIGILEATLTANWNNDFTFYEIPLDDETEEYRMNEYVLTYRYGDEPEVCLYSDFTQLDNSDEDGFVSELPEDEDEFDEEFGEDIVEEALSNTGDLKIAVNKLQEGKQTEFSRIVSSRIKEIVRDLV